mgnify:CR=1 FL=1
MKQLIKAHLLPTKDIGAQLCIYKGEDKPSTNVMKLALHQNQHLHYTSDEEIKKGDWFIHSSHGITNLYQAKSSGRNRVVG